MDDAPRTSGATGTDSEVLTRSLALLLASGLSTVWFFTGAFDLPTGLSTFQEGGFDEGAWISYGAGAWTTALVVATLPVPAAAAIASLMTQVLPIGSSWSFLRAGAGLLGLGLLALAVHISGVFFGTMSDIPSNAPPFDPRVPLAIGLVVVLPVAYRLARSRRRHEAAHGF